MAYLLRRSIFIHTPKTAGQWVAAALDNAGLLTGNLGPIHASPDEIEQEAGFRSDLFQFTFVRHPLSWYRSMWAHRVDEEWEPIDALDWFTPRWIAHWATFTDSCQAADFHDYIYKCAQTFPNGFVSALFDDYTKGCHFVGKQEHLISDLCAALVQAGEEFEKTKLLSTKPRNVRGQKPSRQRDGLYTKELIELVLKLESRAIDRFGYQEDPMRYLSPMVDQIAEQKKTQFSLNKD